MSIASLLFTTTKTLATSRTSTNERRSTFVAFRPEVAAPRPPSPIGSPIDSLSNCFQTRLSSSAVHFISVSCMAQACLTNYFTPKRSARSATLSKSQSEKRKIPLDEENIENLGSNSTKKRRIAVHQPTDGYLPGCDLDQIDKSETRPSESINESPEDF